ncbi:serine protease HTRA3-like [Sinocyclocheilus grahami]|uniref:serine protease HTRA3-like n=1 Tax=Sinocyclocheilus grahami TaxID=75366 RepID=UPI0007AD04D5|nr:PREDICTED: serine protease HTRA3-like [Sinocyclocheilus grahami]
MRNGDLQRTLTSQELPVILNQKRKKMQVILLVSVVFICVEAALADTKLKCPERCDVSKCPSPSCPSGYVPDRCDCCLVCAQGEGEPCGRKDDLPCGDGLECKHPSGKRLSKGVCQCRYSSKVCGSDGNTYGNICRLKAVSRKALQQGLPAITNLHKGPCESNQGPTHPTSPRYKFNFIADVVEKIAPAVVHIELFLKIKTKYPNVHDEILINEVTHGNYGNSGGPLVNLDGEVIGINTLKVAAGISFAIPSDRITRFLNDSLGKQNKEPRSVKKRFIGIRMLTITEELVEELRQQNPDFPDVSSGIYVHEVVPHSPAQKGGIRDGDIIVKLNGEPLMSTSDLKEALNQDTTLLLEVRRGNDDLLFNIEPDVIMQ